MQDISMEGLPGSRTGAMQVLVRPGTCCALTSAVKIRE